MSALGFNRFDDASTPSNAHACNCIGCCKKCGGCVTFHGHAAMCEPRTVSKAELSAIADRLIKEHGAMLRRMASE